MILRLRDKTEITLTEQEAEAVSKMIEQEKEFIKIGTSMFRRTEIASIKPGGISSSDVPNFDRPALAGSVCNGQNSIQREISKRLVKKYPKDWPQNVKDKKVREQIRQEILAEDPKAEWCDHVAGTCACVATVAA